MTGKLRAHDYLSPETPRRRRHWPKPPWYERLLLALVDFPFTLRSWWSGPVGIIPDGDLPAFVTGRQALWQVVRLPLALLLFLYTICCVIAGAMVSLGVFRAFLSHVFAWRLNGGL